DRRGRQHPGRRYRRPGACRQHARRAVRRIGRWPRTHRGRPAMVAHFVRLKFRLLVNSLTGSVGRIIGLVLAAIYGLLIIAIVVVALVGLRFAADFETARIAVMLAGSLVIFGWLALPVFAFGVDETLDPLRFQTY